jgi:hypothetical protein
MNAPKIPSLFKIPRHKNFEYKPLYYDEAKERINERREQLKKEGLTNDDETSMIHLTQTQIKIHHASSIRPIKNKLFTDEKLGLIKYRINQKFQRNQHQKEVRQANTRIILLIGIILLVLYYIFK